MRTKKIRRLSDLTPDNHNANRGNERGKEMISASLRAFGAGRSILVDRKGKVIAGNKTLENAADVGLKELIVVPTDGSKLVVVQRTDLDLDADPKARELAVADNRSAEVNLEWDEAELKRLQEAGSKLEEFFSDEEMEDILSRLSDEPREVGFKEYDDRAAEGVKYTVCPKCGHEFPR